MYFSRSLSLVHQSKWKLIKCDLLQFERCAITINFVLLSIENDHFSIISLDKLRYYVDQVQLFFDTNHNLTLCIHFVKCDKILFTQFERHSLLIDNRFDELTTKKISEKATRDTQILNG